MERWVLDYRTLFCLTSSRPLCYTGRNYCSLLSSGGRLAEIALPEKVAKESFYLGMFCNLKEGGEEGHSIIDIQYSVLRESLREKANWASGFLDK